MKRLLTIVALVVLLSGCAGYRTVQMRAGDGWAPPPMVEVTIGGCSFVVPIKGLDNPLSLAWNGFAVKVTPAFTLEPEPSWGPPAVWGEAGEPTAPDSGDVVAWHGVHP